MGMPSLHIRSHLIPLLRLAAPRAALLCAGMTLGFCAMWSSLPAKPKRAPARMAIMPAPDSLVQVTVLTGGVKVETPRFRSAKLADAFMRELSRTPAAQKYFDSLAYLGPSEDASTARMWFTLEVLGPTTLHEPDLKSRLNPELRRHASGVMRVLEGSLPQLQRDFFTEQLVLPLVHQLQVSSERKALVYGRILDRPFTVDAEGTVSPRSATLTSALIYLEETRLPAERIWPHLEHALQRTAGDPLAYGILEARIAASFPGLQKAN